VVSVAQSKGPPLSAYFNKYLSDFTVYDVRGCGDGCEFVIKVVPTPIPPPKSATPPNKQNVNFSFL
jgi:hypothetical protein